MNRNSFIFYGSFADAINDIPDGEQLSLYRAIAKFALHKEEPELDGQAKTLWKLIRPQLAANGKRYDDGKKAEGRPKTEKPPVTT